VTTPVKFALADLRKTLDAASDDFINVFSQGDGRFVLFKPEGADTQTPHTQDEVYIVISGTGTFRRGDDVVPFVPGDMLFVAAHVPHRFESFSDDFLTWVAFWGPKGGSVPAA
jgi:mannose-6-phosphate isomerase-like protein (cupin superfamily)